MTNSQSEVELYRARWLSCVTQEEAKRLRDEVARLGETAKDARMLATAVLDAKVGCMPPEEMRTIAARIISANPF